MHNPCATATCSSPARRRLALLTLLVLASLVSLQAQAAAYLKFDGVDGASTAEGHKIWISILIELYVQGFSGPPAVSAVPVPAALWLSVSGLLGLLGATRRRRVR